MKIVPIFPPTNDQVIAEFEGRHGFRLPDDYRSFMLKQNGGRAAEQVKLRAKVSGKKISSLDELFAFTDDFDSSIEANLVCYAGRLRADLLPIGSDAGGNVIALSVAGESAGAVFFWHHEAEVEASPDEVNKGLVRVADSFDEMLAV